MADWTYIPTEGAEWQPNAKRASWKPLRKRLKHTLVYRNARWACEIPDCDYVLGEHGHAALYGRCPFHDKKTVHENHEGFLEHQFLQGELLPPLED